MLSIKYEIILFPELSQDAKELSLAHTRDGNKEYGDRGYLRHGRVIGKTIVVGHGRGTSYFAHLSPATGF